jgi:hypothetical protein
MNEHSFDDPQLAILEAQLAAMNLQLSPIEQQRLLYQSGIAAGQQKSKTALRRWRVAAAALAVIVALASIPHWPSAPRPSATSQPDALQMVHRPNAVDLDAWQLSPSEVAATSDELARLAEQDPRLRSRTVAALTRQALEQ